MNPCIDAILLRIADPEQVLSISHYSHDPSASSVDLALARRFPSNSGTAEEAVAARPDIVLLGPHVAPATQTALRAAGARIVSVGVPVTLAESRAQVMTVARALGHPARGLAMVARIDAALAAARPARGTAPVAALIRMGGGLVPGTGTLADELLTRTGFRNRSADYGLAMWDILPMEVMMLHPPHLVLTERASEAAVPGVRFARFPARLLQCGGPNLIEAAGALARIRREVPGT